MAEREHDYEWLFKRLQVLNYYGYTVEIKIDDWYERWQKGDEEFLSIEMLENWWGESLPDYLREALDDVSLEILNDKFEALGLPRIAFDRSLAKGEIVLRTKP